MSQVIEVSKKLWELIQKEDVETLKNMMHENAQFVHMGISLNRDQELDTIKNRRIVYHAFDVEKVSSEDFGCIEVVYTKMKLTAIVGGNEVVNPFVVTEVYTKEKDAYKLASLSFTKVVY